MNRIRRLVLRSGAVMALALTLSGLLASAEGHGLARPHEAVRQVSGTVGIHAGTVLADGETQDTGWGG